MVRLIHGVIQEPGIQFPDIPALKAYGVDAWPVEITADFLQWLSDNNALQGAELTMHHDQGTGTIVGALESSNMQGTKLEGVFRIDDERPMSGIAERDITTGIKTGEPVQLSFELSDMVLAEPIGESILAGRPIRPIRAKVPRVSMVDAGACGEACSLDSILAHRAEAEDACCDDCGARVKVAELLFHENGSLRTDVTVPDDVQKAADAHREKPFQDLIAIRFEGIMSEKHQTTTEGGSEQTDWKAKFEAAQQEVSELNTKVAAADKRTADLEAKLEEMRKQIESAGDEDPEDNPEVKALRDELEQVKADLDEQKALEHEALVEAVEELAEEAGVEDFTVPEDATEEVLLAHRASFMAVLKRKEDAPPKSARRANFRRSATAPAAGDVPDGRQDAQKAAYIAAFKRREARRGGKSKPLHPTLARRLGDDPIPREEVTA